MYFREGTPLKFRSSPLKNLDLPQKESIVFQPSFFRDELFNFGGVEKTFEAPKGANNLSIPLPSFRALTIVINGGL